MGPQLAALWWAAKGDWDRAHKIVQDESDANSAWVHAYLHRVEGDLGNAGYWYRQAGQPIDPFALLKAEGGNLVRVRIWNHATWTKYSDYPDVLKTIRRAHAAGLQVLLDFHYSDDWADGGKQIAPVAWAKRGTAAQAKALHDYTRDILARLDGDGAMPKSLRAPGTITSRMRSSAASSARTRWRFIAVSRSCLTAMSTRSRMIESTSLPT